MAQECNHRRHHVRQHREKRPRGSSLVGLQVCAQAALRCRVSSCCLTRLAYSMVARHCNAEGVLTERRAAFPLELIFEGTPGVQTGGGSKPEAFKRRPWELVPSMGENGGFVLPLTTTGLLRPTGGARRQCRGPIGRELLIKIGSWPIGSRFACRRLVHGPGSLHWACARPGPTVQTDVCLSRGVSRSEHSPPGAVCRMVGCAPGLARSTK